jgi:uncharacterized cupin superfamily protein
MSYKLIVPGNTAVELTLAPIEPSWIIEGNPVAKNKVLSQSADRTASTIIWECSDGKFEWHYDNDETILILEGSIVLHNSEMMPTRFGPGDVVFIMRGAKVFWDVEGYVRKLAFCRRTQPPIIGLMLRIASRAKRSLTSLATVLVPGIERNVATRLHRAVPGDVRPDWP